MEREVCRKTEDGRELTNSEKNTSFQLTVDEMALQLNDIVERKEEPNHHKGFIIIAVESVPIGTQKRQAYAETGVKVYPELTNPNMGFSVSLKVNGKGALLGAGLSTFIDNEEYAPIVDIACRLSEKRLTNIDGDKDMLVDFLAYMMKQ